MDWRAQIRKNEHRTRIVIMLFLGIYIFVGFLIDLVLNSNTSNPLPLSTVALDLVSFQIFPYATVTMAIAASIALLITYTFHNKIMLLGTEYREVKQDSTAPEEKQLYHVVEELTVAASMRYVPRVFVIEADYMNAFASGYSEKSAMVAITRGLLNKLNRNELQAVMAHELSHIQHHDIKLTLMASVLTNIILVAVDIVFYSMLMGKNNKVDGRLLAVVILLRYLLPLVTVLLILYLSRTRELMADAGCVQLMRDNQALASALLKIHHDHKDNQANYQTAYQRTAHEEIRQTAYLYDPSEAGFRASFSLTSLFSTHPSLKDRLQALGYEYDETKDL